MKTVTRYKATWHQKTRLTGVVWSCLAAFAALPAHADFYSDYRLSKDYQKCTAKASKDKSWFDSVQCMDHEASRQEKRMQAAQAKRLAEADGEKQKKWMEQSQNFWEKHREAECQSLWRPNSGNSSDLASECHMLKTARRAKELETNDR